MWVAVVLSAAACGGKSADGLFDRAGSADTGGGGGCTASCSACDPNADCSPADGSAGDEPALDGAPSGVDSAGDTRARPLDASLDAREAGNNVRADGGADASRDGCTASTEVCDGLDNNCDGRVDEGAVCPSGCVGLARQGAGYMLCYGDAVHRTWPLAQSDCVARGMHLVRVDDAAENRWINASAVSLNFLEQIWIGGIYIPEVAEWEWTDGTAFWTSGTNGQPVNGLFSNWRSGEPQNDGSDGCADKLFDNTELWEDRPCSVSFAYMCER
jgi:hypothetical protein